MRRSFIALLCIVLSGVALGEKTTSVISLDQFTKFDEFGTIKISPDGEHVAFTTGKYGRSIVAFLNLKDKKITGGIRCPDGFEIYDFYWVSGTRVIYMLAERQLGKVAPTPTGEILAIDRDGKNQKLIYGYRAGESQLGTNIPVRQSTYATPEFISSLKADYKSILIAEHPWHEGASSWRYDYDAKPLIVKLDVYSGKKSTLGVAPLANATVLVDRNDQVRFAIGWDEKSKFAASWKPDLNGKWIAFEMPGFREESINPYLFDSDKESILFTGVREGETMTALYRLDLKTKEVVKVYGFDGGAVSGLIRDFSGNDAVGVIGYTDRPVYHWLNEGDRAAKIYTSLYKAFAGQDVTVSSKTDDGRLVIVFVNSDTNPGDYYIFDTQTMKAEHLRAAKRWIVPENMRPKESFAFKARDGLELHGYLTRPTGVGPFPLVVLPHGGPHGVRDDRDFDWEVQLLANRGYAVLQVNFRGSGGYGMDFELAGHREWGAKMQDDVTDATHWAIEQKVTQSDRICIFGASYGGFAALMGAVREPKLYRCAIGYAGIYDLELMLSSADIPTSRSGRTYLETALGSDHAQLRSRSPVYNAQQIEAPILLIHGREDWRADFEQAKRMKAALEKNHKQFEWMALSREGHGVYDEETRREVYERILSFLDRHLMQMDAVTH